MSTIITRKEAQLSGLTKYFTGKECVNGHLAERYVQSGTCSQCINGNSPSTRRVDSKTLIIAAENIEKTALTDYQANIERATTIYNKALSKATEMREQARENALIEASAPQKRVVSTELKQELGKLITVWVVYKPETRDADEAFYLSLLKSRCKELTIDDLRYRNRKRENGWHEIRCYTDDLNVITQRQIVKPQSQH